MQSEAFLHILTSVYFLKQEFIKLHVTELA